MMVRLVRLIGIFLGCIVATSPVFSKEIKWYLTDFPPYIILNESGKKRGIDNQIIQTVMEHLPNYNFSFETANYTRILNNFKAGRPGIVTPLFKTQERQKYVLYTKTPSYLVLPNGFIFRKKDKERFLPFISDDGSIDIEAICSSKKFKIGVCSGRSYYGIIDDMLRKHKNDNVFYERSGIDHLGILKMVEIKRLDATFGFPVEIQYGGFGDNLEFLHVDKMTSYIPVFFGAPKNDWGRHKINLLNSIIEKKGILDIFAHYYMDWLSEDIKLYYEKLRHAYYDKMDE